MRGLLYDQNRPDRDPSALPLFSIIDLFVLPPSTAVMPSRALRAVDSRNLRVVPGVKRLGDLSLASHFTTYPSTWPRHPDKVTAGSNLTILRKLTARTSGPGIYAGSLLSLCRLYTNLYFAWLPAINPRHSLRTRNTLATDGSLVIYTSIKTVKTEDAVRLRYAAPLHSGVVFVICLPSAVFTIDSRFRSVRAQAYPHL